MHAGWLPHLLSLLHNKGNTWSREESSADMLAAFSLAPSPEAASMAGVAPGGATMAVPGKGTTSGRSVSISTFQSPGKARAPTTAARRMRGSDAPMRAEAMALASGSPFAWTWGGNA